MVFSDLWLHTAVMCLALKPFLSKFVITVLLMQWLV